MKTREQIKQENRAAKEAYRAIKYQEPEIVETDPNDPVDCACVIHGDTYGWNYVDTLYSMLSRNLSRNIRMHVYTEEHREVPSHMIKHVLTEWPGIRGNKKSWWYKMQLFNPEHHAGQLLYLDLDTVIVNNLDWVLQLGHTRLWTIRDFKTLWKPKFQGINSSVMYWHTEKFADIWTEFAKQDIPRLCAKYHGDQDYLSAVLKPNQRRFFPEKTAVSWRWQALDGGIDPYTRKHLSPGLGTQFGPETSLLIFHGQPKPYQIADPVIKNHWR
jgi:hypothetical protein